MNCLDNTHRAADAQHSMPFAIHTSCLGSKLLALHQDCLQVLLHRRQAVVRTQPPQQTFLVAFRYLLAENKDALYVSFIGTTKRRDIMTNANIMQETLWPDLAEVGAADTQVSPSAACTSCSTQATAYLCLNFQLHLCGTLGGAEEHIQYS